MKIKESDRKQSSQYNAKENNNNNKNNSLNRNYSSMEYFWQQCGNLQSNLSVADNYNVSLK